MGFLDSMLEPVKVDLEKSILKLETKLHGPRSKFLDQDAKKLVTTHRSTSIPSSVIPKWAHRTFARTPPVTSNTSPLS